MLVAMADGTTYKVGKLLGDEKTNAKLAKGAGSPHLTMGLSLAPGKLSGYNVCTDASPECLKGCLNTAGMGVFSTTQIARIAKTRYYYQDRTTFLIQLDKEIKLANNRAKKAGKTLAIRLNVVSDVEWEIKHPELFTNNPDVVFYGYSKHIKLMRKYLNGKLPVNCHLTFSRSEVNDNYVREVLGKGGNVAIIFDILPSKYKYLGYDVIDGNINDQRFTDPKNVVVGLTPKGRLRKNPGNFVVKSNRISLV